MNILLTGKSMPQILPAGQKKGARGNVRAQAAAVSERITKELSGGSRHANASLERLKQNSRSYNRKLQFKVNHESNEVTVKVVDGSTNKVIKVLPPEELQRLRRGINESAGALLDEKV
ncbi:MAG: flagellar protein FlaG [Spirochaetaceae bacterium]|jgi:flagellar protein FlaG|nr:flagellar protein FlaG [Spirochaetaceae bacterium]